jgi:adenylate cyclase
LRSRLLGWIRFSRWPLAWRMAAIFWLIAFLPALAVMAYWLYETESTQSEAQAEALQDTAARIAGRLSQLITDTGRVNAFLALNPDVVGLVAAPSRAGADKVLATLHRVIVANPDVELIMVMDADGKVITSTDPDLIGRNFGFRDYFKLAIQGRPHVTGLVVGAVSGNTGAYFSHPISTGSGKVIGAYVTKIVAKAFVGVIESERKSKAQTAFLVDGDGVVVYHPSNEWMFHSIMPLSERAQASILADRRFRIPKVESLDIPSLHEAVMTYRTAGSVRWQSPKTKEYERAGYAQVPVHNWTVVVSAEERYLALAQLRSEKMMAAGAGAVILAFGFAFILLRVSMIKPLRSIGTAAQRIARGEYRDTAADEASGELGEIANALNIAAEELHRRQREHDASGRILVPEIRQKLLPRRPDGGNIARMAVVYCAVTGIYEMFDRRSSSEVLAALSDYSEQVSEIVKPWGGQINNISGHSIVAVFAAPLTDDSLESHALSAALAIQRRIAEFNRTRVEMNEPVVEVAIGVCTAGILVTGASIAYERYLNAMLNDGINVSGTLATLSMQAPGRPVMINHTTFIGVRNRGDITLVSLGQQKLRGRAELSEVYSVAFEPAAPLAPPGPRRDPRQERTRGADGPEAHGSLTRFS